MPATARPHNEITGIKKPSSVLVRGFSFRELAVQLGFLPSNHTDQEFIDWAKGPRGYSTFELWQMEPGNENMTLEDFFDWLGFVEAAQEAAIIAQIAADAAAAAASAAAALTSENNAETAETNAETAQAAAEAAQAAAEAAQAAAEAAAGSITQASASDIWIGTDNTKSVTSLGLKNASAFVASDAGEVAANVWTPNMNLGINRSYALGANTTIAAPTNMKDGVTYIWKFKQDGTGGRTLTFNAIFDFGTAAPVTIASGANKVSRIIGTYDATENKIMATLHKAA